ncbi:TRAP transporter small permease subunit [Deinococcus caeni]
MSALMGLARGIDRFSHGLGVLTGLLTLLMIGVGLFNVLGRFVDRYAGTALSSNSLLEAQWYLFSAVFLIGGAYVLSRDEHVRVDLLYSRLTQRARAWINLLGTLLFLLPFCVLMLNVSWPWFLLSYRGNEGSPDPGGLLRWPVKLLVPLGFVLLLIAGVSMGLRALGVLSGHHRYEEHDEVQAALADVELSDEERRALDELELARAEALRRDPPAGGN